MTILFLLFFSMTGVMIDSARVLSSDGYFRVAARSAAMTVFGDYNRELYEQYGFFVYGGYDGIGADDLNADFLTLLEKNLAAAPEGQERIYADLYRFSEVASEVVMTGTLMEKKIFYDQVKGFLKRQAVKKVLGQTTKKVPENTSTAKDKLAIAKDYEDGKYDDLKEETGGNESADGTSPGESEGEGTAQDTAGGNPLTVFSEMMGNGILSLVCEENEVSKQEIPKREATEESFDDGKDEEVPVTGKGAADYLTELMGNDDMENLDTLHEYDSESMGSGIGAEKTELFLYALEQFADYTKPLEKTTKYGIEYLVAGKEKENLNLSYVVNRLLAIRLLVNMAYVMSSPVLQEKSLATATALAGFTALPPVIAAVQYAILMILSFEESCIDVTALLEGREVPLFKNASNFKMKYEEICICTRELFKKKAAACPKAEKFSTSGINYQEYLYLFFLLQKEENLRSRAGDLIQYDLRERYNQTFTIHTCICSADYQMEYRNASLFVSLPFLAGKNWSFRQRSQEVFYEYKSK